MFHQHRGTGVGVAIGRWSYDVGRRRGPSPGFTGARAAPTGVDATMARVLTSRFLRMPRQTAGRPAELVGRHGLTELIPEASKRERVGVVGRETVERL